MMVSAASFSPPKFKENMEALAAPEKLERSARFKSVSYLYFLNLKSDRIQPEEFRRHWDNLLSYPLTPQECTVMMHRTARAVSRLPHDRTFGELSAILHQGIGAWEKRAAIAMLAFDAQALSSSLWAYATLGIVPQSGFLRLWQNRAEAVMTPGSSQLKTRDVACSLWSLAALSARTGYAGLRETACKLSKAVKSVSPNEMDNTQIASACLFFGFPVRHPIMDETETVSSSEQRLSDVFRNAGLRLNKNDGWISKLKHQADIAFSADGHLFLIEYDGPTHFSGTAQGRLAYNASTQLQSALIRQCAPNATLLRVRYQDGDRLTSAPDRTLLTKMLCEAAKQGKGAYETFTKNDGSIGVRPHLPEYILRGKAAATGPSLTPQPVPA